MAVPTIARGVVLGSMLLAVAVGIWPLVAQPSLAAATLTIALVCAALARWRLPLATMLVLALAFVSYGIVRLAAGPSWGGVPFWLAAFVGLAIGGLSWTTWSAPRAWQLPLAWWATGVAVSWPVIAARALDFTFEPSPAVTGPVVGAALVQMSVALWMDRLLSGPWNRHVGLLMWPLAASALVTAIAALYQRFVDLAWLSGPPWVGLGRSVGMMGDANPMGVATALLAPVLIVLVARERARSGHPAGLALAAAGAIVLWAGAWTSGARSTLILIAGGVAALMAAWMVERRVPLRTMIGGALVLAGLGGGVMAVAVARATPGTPIGRLVASLPNRSPGAIAYETLWRRDGYGLAAVEAFWDRPITGVGIGRFTGMSPHYYARVEPRAIPPDNAQSLWRHTLAERGVLGLLPVAWLTVLTLVAIVGPAPNGWLAAMRVLLAAFGVTLMFGYPVQDPAIAAALGTLVALACRHASPFARLDNESTASGWPWVAILVLGLLGAAVDLLM